MSTLTAFFLIAYGFFLESRILFLKTFPSMNQLPSSLSHHIKDSYRGIDGPRTVWSLYFLVV